MTDLQRLAGIVLSPGKTFEDIHQRPTWILPVALLLLFNFLGDFVVFRVLITDANFEQMARTKVQWDAGMAGSHRLPDSEEQQIGTLRRERKYWYLLPLFAVPVSVFGVSIFPYRPAAGPGGRYFLECACGGLLGFCDLSLHRRNFHQHNSAGSRRGKFLSRPGGSLVSDEPRSIALARLGAAERVLLALQTGCVPRLVALRFGHRFFQNLQEPELREIRCSGCGLRSALPPR